MERRKILLGSGAALATVLAGCSSSETGDDDPDDDSDESFSDDNGETDDNGDDYDDNGDDDDDDDDDEYDDVPGVDDLKVGSDKLTITSVNRDGDKLDVVVVTDITDRDALRKELETIADDMGNAIADRDHFKSEIKTVKWIVEHEGSRVFAVYVDVQWVLKYLDDELSAEEFADKVYETKE